MRAIRDRLADLLFEQHEKRFDKMCDCEVRYRDELPARVVSEKVEHIRTWGLGDDLEQSCLGAAKDYADRRVAKNGKKHLHDWYRWSAYWALAIWARIQVELAKVGI